MSAAGAGRPAQLAALAYQNAHFVFIFLRTKFDLKIRIPKQKSQQYVMSKVLFLPLEMPQNCKKSHL